MQKLSIPFKVVEAGWLWEAAPASGPAGGSPVITSTCWEPAQHLLLAADNIMSTTPGPSPPPGTTPSWHQLSLQSIISHHRRLSVVWAVSVVPGVAVITCGLRQVDWDQSQRSETGMKPEPEPGEPLVRDPSEEAGPPWASRGWARVSRSPESGVRDWASWTNINPNPSFFPFSKIVIGQSIFHHVRKSVSLIFPLSFTMLAS